MKTKDQVLELLQAAQGRYISGRELGETLHITRSAVWKSIRSLREQGIIIEAVTNLGYRLPARTDALQASYIRDTGLAHWNLPISFPQIHVTDTIGSTNDWAKETAEAERFTNSGSDPLSDFSSDSMTDHVFIANAQTGGRGRRGRSFYSAPDTGIYMTILLRPHMDFTEAAALTGMTAVAAAEALEEVTGKAPQIKWVNDLFYEDRKIAGILTESAASLETGTVEYVVIGIGINIFPPANGYPKELQQIAGSLYPAGNAPENLRNRIIAALLCRFYRYYSAMDPKFSSVWEESHADDHLEHSYLEGYRTRSYLDGKWIKIHPHSPTESPRYAKVLGIDDEMHLIVESESGKQEVLSTGEVSVVRY